VPRSSPPDRLRTIVDAATGVFLDKGYKRTLMTDVAAALELSPGTLYNHVESKEALFHLCLLPGVELPRTPPPFPTPPMSETLASLSRELKASLVFPRLHRAVKNPDPDAVGELREILLEHYELVERRHRVVALIERSAHDIPELGDLFYTRGRQRMTDALARYLRVRSADGGLTPIDDPDTAALLLRESLSWFAYHRHFDPAAHRLDDPTIAETVIDLLLTGFAPR
jgi:AcrR family transcriptional regulator